MLDDAGVTRTRAEARRARVNQSTATGTESAAKHRRKDTMTSTVARITTCVATLMAIAAIGAPSALAIGRSSWTTNHPLFLQTPGLTHAVVSRPPPNLPYVDHSVLVFPKGTAAAGFDWSAAAIGALTAAVACAVVIGCVLDVRRRRHPTMA